MGPICSLCEHIIETARLRLKAMGEPGKPGPLWDELVAQLDGVVDDCGRERIARAITEALLRGEMSAQILVPALMKKRRRR
jgi:hypothetical protein